MKPKFRFAVKGFMPSGAICTIGTMPTHRDARRHMLKRENELRIRFGITLFVAGR